MVCEWTGSYVYQPNTPENERCLTDTICDAIMEYVKRSGDEHGMKITTTADNNSWYSHGKPVEVMRYHLQSGAEAYPIEEVAESVLAYYDAAMGDEPTLFGKNAVYIGEPWSTDDLEWFTQEYMVEYWDFQFSTK